MLLSKFESENPFFKRYFSAIVFIGENIKSALCLNYVLTELAGRCDDNTVSLPKRQWNPTL